MFEKWLVVEGLDGSGKTSIIEYLTHTLESKGYKVVNLKGLGSGKIGEHLRKLLLENKIAKNSTAMSFALSLIDSHNEALKNIYDDNTIVITDRYISSFYAYNVLANQDLGSKNLYDNVLLNHNFFSYKPDIEIMVEVDIPIAKARLADRADKNFIDEKDYNYFVNVKLGFDKAHKIANKRIKIDNNGRFTDTIRLLNNYIIKQITGE